MAVITCDICGGKLTITGGGIAICEDCGMEHSKERLQEKLKDIKKGGTVQVESTGQIDNFLRMAENAVEADNNSEAEMYCNKIIEIDTNNAKAWFLKGKAAGWQSTITNNRLKEAAVCFARTIDCSPEGEIDNYKSQSTEQITKLALALIAVRGQRFEKYPDEEEANGIIHDLDSVQEAVTLLANKGGVLITGCMEPIANVINNSVVDAFNKKILPEYKGGNDDLPDDNRLIKFVEQSHFCILLLEKAIELSDTDEVRDIKRYENLIDIHKQVRDSCAYDFYYSESQGKKIWIPTRFLTDSSKKEHAKKIAQYKAIVSEFKNKEEEKRNQELKEKKKKEEEESKKRFEEYWAAHAKEKADLEIKKEGLTAEISNLELEVKLLKEKIRQENEESKANISKLQNELNSLGVFKGKEKKILQAEIASAHENLGVISAKLDQEQKFMTEKIIFLNKQIGDIDTELTKKR